MAASKFGQFADSATSASNDGIVNQSPTGQYGGASPSASGFAAQGPNPEWGGGQPVGTPTSSPSGGGVLPTSVAGSYGGGPDGNGNGSNDLGRYAFADGGAIGDGDTDTNQPVDIDAALGLVQNALAFGRQKNGLPASLSSQAPSAGTVGPSTGAALEPSTGQGATKFQDPSFTPMQTSYAGGGQVDTPVKKPPGMSPATYAGQPTLPMGPQTGLPKWIKKNDGDEDDTDTQHFADGGAVEDDNADSADSADSEGGSQGVIPDGAPAAPSASSAQGGSQPQDPKRLVSYLMGADGVTPDVANAMEARVDPQGQMDPSERKLRALAQAGGPQQAWGLMQHYRQKFNAYNAFAKVAAQGSQHRPADLSASTQAASQAYANVPDGTSMTFQPTRGGVAVTMKKLGTAQKPQTQQSFADGGAVEDDSDDDQSQSDPGMISTDVSAARRQAPLPTPDPRGAPAGGGTASVTQGNDLSPDGSNPVRNFVLSIPQYLQFLTKQGQYDSVIDKGADAALDDVSKNTPADTGSAAPVYPGPVAGRAPAQGGTSLTSYVHNFSNPSQSGGATPGAAAAPQQPALDQSIVRQAHELYPNASQEPLRQKFINEQLTAQNLGQNKLDVADRSFGGRLTLQNAKDASINGRNALNNKTKSDIAIQQIMARQAQSGNATLAGFAKALETGLGMQPAQAMQEALKQMQTVREQGGQPGAPAAPAAPAGPQLSAQDQQALQWAKQNATDPRAAKIMQRLGQ